MKRRREWLIAVVSVVLVTACGQTDSEAPSAVAEMPPPAASEPAPVGSLEITAVEDEALGEFFSKQVDVFGVKVVATPDSADEKLLWAANVMAQYFDNDEDGEVDNPAMVASMIANNALLVMFASEEIAQQSGLRDSGATEGYWTQGNHADETNPEEGFDASIEEILHLISETGYGELYPEAFGTYPGTRLTDAMDLARGGQFHEIPAEYPEGAWYSYDDETCLYDCMAAEYFYWALSTILGAQSDPERCEWISNEWRACTAEQVAEVDPAVYALMTDPEFKLPTVLPDGSYRQ